MKLLRVVLALVALLACAVPAFAQATVINPVTVEFLASVDHATLGLDGAPLVASYEMRIFVQNPLGSTPIFSTSLGKPTPGAGNLISITNAVWFSGLTPNVKYVAKVAAIGPTGEGVSALSNPFGNQGPPMAPTNVSVKKQP